MTSSYLRHILAIVWIACGAYGAFQLATTEIEVIRFWDEADLVLDVNVPQFESEGGRLGAISYATRKIGYAYPIKLVRDQYGNFGGVVWNLVWLLVLLLLPIPGTKDWHAYALRFGAVLSLPYTMKYVTMINPTLQAMGLWLVLATLFIYWRRSYDSSRLAARFLPGLIGIVGGLIVLTDFKWLPFVGAGIILLLLADPPQNLTDQTGWKKWWRVLLRWVLPQGAAMLLWVPVILAITAFLFRPYSDMVYAMLFALPEQVGVVRPGVSDNLLIHLWYLGGFGIVLGAVGGLIILSRTHVSLVRRYAPYWLIAALICAAFSFVVWPRGARMFAPALALMINIAAVLVTPRLLLSVNGMTRKISWALIFIMTVSIVFNVRHIRAAIGTPTGLTRLKDHITAHTVGPLGGTPEEEPVYKPNLMGCYMLPLMIMRASRDGDMMWYSLAHGLREPSNWAFLNPVTDGFTIEEQAAGAVVTQEWKQDQYFMRESMERHGQTTDTIPAPFYATPYYICELTFEGSTLTKAIQSESISEWRVVYIGHFYNRPFPGVDTTENAP